MTLNEARSEIDKIDDELLRLLLRRLELSSIIGKIKKEGNMPTFDQAREDKIFDRLNAASMEKYEYIEPIFMKILGVSRKVQTKKTNQRLKRVHIRAWQGNRNLI